MWGSLHMHCLWFLFPQVGKGEGLWCHGTEGEVCAAEKHNLQEQSQCVCVRARVPVLVTCVQHTVLCCHFTLASSMLTEPGLIRIAVHSLSQAWREEVCWRKHQ